MSLSSAHGRVKVLLAMRGSGATKFARTLHPIRSGVKELFLAARRPDAKAAACACARAAAGYVSRELPLAFGGESRGRGPRACGFRVCARAAVAFGVAAADERGRGEARADEERAGQDGVERSLRVDARLRDVYVVAAVLLQLARGFVETPLALAARGLVLLLRVEHEGLHHLVAEPRRVLVHHPQSLAAEADEHVAHGRLGAVQNRIGDGLGRVDGRRQRGLDFEKVLRVPGELRVYRARLYQRDGDGRALLFQLHSERVGEAVDRVLRGAVDALQRDCAVADGRAHVDERAAALAQVFDRGERAVDSPPEVRLEQAAHVLDGRVDYLPVDGDARVVDPSVYAPEAFERRLCDAPHVVLPPNVGRDVYGLARRHEPYAARRARDYEHLLAQLLQLNVHTKSSPCAFENYVFKVFARGRGARPSGSDPARPLSPRARAVRRPCRCVSPTVARQTSGARRVCLRGAAARPASAGRR